jgi:hypothetical protein
MNKHSENGIITNLNGNSRQSRQPYNYQLSFFLSFFLNRPLLPYGVKGLLLVNLQMIGRTPWTGDWPNANNYQHKV